MKKNILRSFKNYFQHDVRGEEFPIHAQFKDMVAKAQVHANKKQGEVEVSWRGYKMKVKPNLPKFTMYDLDTILLEAVDSLVELEKREKKKEEEEEEVRANQKRSLSDDMVDVFTDAPPTTSDKAYKLSSKKVKARKV